MAQLGILPYPFGMLAFLAAAVVTAPGPTDVCQAMIPPRLAAELARDLPDFTQPRQADTTTERLAVLADEGGWPCPFVAIADVDGDGNLDRAVVLKHKSQPTSRLVVARNVDGLWRIELQREWPFALSAAVVEPLEAGLYEQKQTNRDAASQLDNLNSIQSDHAGFLAGQESGPKAAYFLQNNKWQELWLED